jgi:hypothetical protein
MTALAAGLALVPIAHGMGKPGSEIQAPNGDRHFLRSAHLYRAEHGGRTRRLLPLSKRSFMKLRITGLFLGIASLTPLFPHDLYIMLETFRVKPGQIVAVKLHNGDAFPDSEGPPATARLEDTRMLWKGGGVELKGFREEHKALVTSVPIGDGSTGSLILTATLSANSRSYDAKKFQSYLEDEGLVMVSKYRRQHGEEDKSVTELYSKYAKALIVNGSPSNFCTLPVGLKIEIVPAVDPATLKPGAALPVQVLFDGKPAAGLTIETTWSTGAPAKPSVVGHTGRNGRLSIPLENGKCRITTGNSRLYRDQSVANWETFFATLTFEVSGK